MSGIEEMKEKMKMKKMSLNDLPVPSQEKKYEENHTVHTAVNHNRNTAVQLYEQQYNNTEVSENVNQYSNTAKHTDSKTVNTNNDLNGYQNAHFQVNETKPTAIEVHSNTAKQQNQTVYRRKVTLYLTEEMYKAFNDIYAQRIIEGRKTDKSELICEAVALLHQNEQKK